MKVFTQKEIKEIRNSDKDFFNKEINYVKHGYIKGSDKEISQKLTISFNQISDNFRANNPERNYNINLLESLGFEECGAYSTSGVLRAELMKNGKIKVVYGIRSSIGGKWNKYFSLSKKYDSFKEFVTEFKKIEKKMKVKS